MGKTWDDLSSMVKKGVSVLAKKTDEYTKIGKIKVEMLSIKRDIDNMNESIGNKVYQMIAEQKNSDVASDSQIKDFIARNQELRNRLQKKNEELEAVRQAYADKTGQPLDENGTEPKAEG